MKRSRKFVAFILAALVCVLTACSGGDATGGMDISDKNEDPSAMGRYMEAGIGLPEMKEGEYSISTFKNQAGEIELYNCFREDGKDPVITRFVWRDQKWNQESADWLNTDLSKDMTQIEVFLGQDGKYYAFGGPYVGGGLKPTLLRSDDGDKTVEDVTPKVWKSQKENKDSKGSASISSSDDGVVIDGENMEYPSVESPLVLKNGNIVYRDQFEGTIYLYSVKEEVSKLDVDLNSGYIVLENQIIGANKAADKILFINSETLETEREVVVESSNKNSLMGPSFKLVIEQDGTLYRVDTAGIHRLGKENTMWETVVEGSLNTMAMPSAYIQNMLVLPGEIEEYYVNYYNTGDGIQELKHYVYDKTISSVPNKQLNVYSLQENSTVRQAIFVFHRSHPDVKVNYIVAGGDETGTTLADNIKALNTELLSENGADILFLDGLPIDSFIEKGILADLGEWLGEMEKSGELLGNLLESYKRDGVLYGVPIRFDMPLVSGSQGLDRNADSLDKLEAYAKEFTKIPLFRGNYDNFLEMFLNVYYEELLDETGAISKDKLVAFLERSAAMKEDEAIKTGSPQDDGNVDVSGSYSFGHISGGSVLGGNPDIFRGNTMDVVNEKAGLAFYQIGGFSDMMTPTAVKKYMDGDITDINGRFIPQGIAGLNNASKEKQLAGEFLTLLLSEEIQGMNVYDGFPVNSKALEEWTLQENDRATMTITSTSINEADSVMLDMVYPTLESRREIVDLIKGLTKPVHNDHVLINMILTETEAFMKGEVSAEAAAEAAIKKVNIYLAEQN